MVWRASALQNTPAGLGQIEFATGLGQINLQIVFG